MIGTTAEHLDEMTVADVPPEASVNLDDDARRRIDALLWFGAQGAGVAIGDGTTVREQCTVHQGTEHPTTLGDGVFVMNKSHIGHDAELGDRVRVAPIAMVGGHAWVGADAEHRHGECDSPEPGDRRRSDDRNARDRGGRCWALSVGKGESGPAVGRERGRA